MKRNHIPVILSVYYYSWRQSYVEINLAFRAVHKIPFHTTLLKIQEHCKIAVATRKQLGSNLPDIRQIHIAKYPGMLLPQPCLDHWR